MMDNAKAKEAVKKAMKAKAMASIDPEVQGQMSAMQPADGLINPYGRIGTVGANTYNPGNMVDGSPIGEARAVGRQLMP